MFNIHRRKYVKTNEELLAEANTINFHLRVDGKVNYRRHSKYELGLYFIKQALEYHGMDLYKYGLVEYVDAKTPVKIICPIHGIFEVSPTNHLAGNKCRKCAHNNSPSTEEWINNALKVHKHRYDYSKVDYIKAHTKITIICKEHGEFEQTPAHHMSGKNCPKCSGHHVPSTEEWVEKAQKIHGHTYLYHKSQYISSHVKLVIVCKEHGDFEQTPASHLSGKGCPKCAGHNHSILYLLYCVDSRTYKIGITNNIKRRLAEIGGNLVEVLTALCDSPRIHERHLHELYKEHRSHNIYVNSGNTEFFSLTEQQVQEVINYMKEL